MPALTTLLLTLILIGVFWALIIRPQQQRQRDHLAMVADLAAGDRVEAFSGIHGTLTEVQDHTVRIEVAPGVVLTMARLAIASKIDDAREDEDEGEGDDDVEDSVISTEGSAEASSAPGQEDPK